MAELYCRYECIIRGGLQFSGIYEVINKWIEDNPYCYYDKTQGIPYIDGKIYPSRIRFFSGEDQLAFRLRFSEYLY